MTIGLNRRHLQGWLKRLNEEERLKRGLDGRSVWRLANIAGYGRRLADDVLPSPEKAVMINTACNGRAGWCPTISRGQKAGWG